LKYSRWVEVSIVPDERAETLVRASVDHFAAIGGIPLLAVFDRATTVAVKWARDGQVTEWNALFAGVALDLGLGIEVCWPGFVGAAFGKGPVVALLGLVVSTVLLVLNSYVKEYNLGEIAQKHRQAGSDLWLIREQFLSLLVDLAMREKPIEALQEQRDALVRQLHGIYRGAPSTNSKGYKAAQDALKKYEDMAFSDAEIDAFLPKELKRGKPNATSKTQ
jgi:hypothetical protein